MAFTCLSVMAQSPPSLTLSNGVYLIRNQQDMDTFVAWANNPLNANYSFSFRVDALPPAVAPQTLTVSNIITQFRGVFDGNNRTFILPPGAPNGLFAKLIYKPNSFGTDVTTVRNVIIQGAIANFNAVNIGGLAGFVEVPVII